MISYEHITVHVYPVLGAHIISITFKGAEDNAAPEWHGLRYAVPEIQYRDLEDLLGTIAEELFNAAPYTERATSLREAAQSSGGLIPTLDELKFADHD